MKRVAALLLLASLSANAFAFAPFVVSDIRIDGLSRIAAGTVYNYLPVDKGDRMTNAQAQRAIRALYDTKFFTDGEFSLEGDILVIKVIETARKKPAPVEPNTTKFPLCLSEIPIGAKRSKFCSSDL